MSRNGWKAPLIGLSAWVLACSHPAPMAPSECAKPTPAPQALASENSSDEEWVFLGTHGPTERHEAAYVQVGERFYLLGGPHQRNGYIEEADRGDGPRKPVESYDPKTDTWAKHAFPPIELHHFQGIVDGTKILVVGAMVGPFQQETTPERIYIYDTAEDAWSTGAEIPSDRRRSAAGAVRVDDAIYVLGGAVGGHRSDHTAVAWFDRFDLKTQTWTRMPDMPRPRHHFRAVRYGRKLIAAGGRVKFPESPVVEIDVFDLDKGTWETLPERANRPVPRSSGAAVVVGDQLVMLAGQDERVSHTRVDSLDLKTLRWRQLPSMLEGRHGIDALVCGSAIYVVTGAGTNGAHDQHTSQEALVVDRSAPSCSPKVPGASMSAE